MTAPVRCIFRVLAVLAAFALMCLEGINQPSPGIGWGIAMCLILGAVVLGADNVKDPKP